MQTICQAIIIIVVVLIQLRLDLQDCDNHDHDHYNPHNIKLIRYQPSTASHSEMCAQLLINHQQHVLDLIPLV